MRLIVTILGVDHHFQRNDRTGEFQKLVCEQLGKAPIDLIAEEAKESDCTVAQRIASDKSIRWLNVDATNEDKIRLGIFDELLNRPMPWIIEGDMFVGQKGRYLPRADGIREELWISRILADKFDAALVICGLLHMQSLADRLVGRDCDVSQINACATGWYKEQYGETKLFRDCDGNLWYEHRYRSPLQIFPR